MEMKGIRVDVRTGEVKEVTDKREPLPGEPLPEGVDLKKVEKLIKYAEAQGWI